MKFILERASGIRDNKSLCKKAIAHKDPSAPRYEYPKYSIEIDTLQDLLDLQEEVGELIINSERILIYDTYVE